VAMRILVTAGPTRERIDPVRFISNHSTGKMGYAMAEAALAQGHEVVLVSGPVTLAPPAGARLVPVVSATEMCEAVENHVEWCEVLIMVAAVADWRPAQPRESKIKKTELPAAIEMEPTTDILQRVRPKKGGRFFIGFAAETERMREEAQRKIEEKDLDAIVANNVADPRSGFAVETNKAMLVARDGTIMDLPLMKKSELARTIMKWIMTRIAVEKPS